MKKTYKIGWTKSKIWWENQFDMNLKIQLTNTQKQSVLNGHVIILANVF